MQVTIKEFNVNMEIKTRGIELGVNDTSNEHLGDLFITKTKLIWCKGQTTRDNGKEITWKKFIKLMDEL